MLLLTVNLPISFGSIQHTVFNFEFYVTFISLLRESSFAKEDTMTQ